MGRNTYIVLQGIHLFDRKCTFLKIAQVSDILTDTVDIPQ